jgi:DNA adenine methylase
VINYYVDQKIRSALNYYGGKATLCRRILQLSPPHTTYVEGYAGGLSVLLNKFKSDIEVACDISPELINFYHVLVSTPERIIEKVHEIPFGKDTFYAARAAKNKGDELTRAVNFLIRQRMSYSGCGMTWAEGEGKEGSWETLPYDLPVVAHRLKDVKIVLRKAYDVIQEYDSPEAFFYLDPPYYRSTRVSPKVYVCEMSEMDHLRLLRLIRTLKGNVILSGYDHHMYNRELPGWDRVEIDIAAFSSPLKGEKSRRTEVLWVKPMAA